MDTTSDELLTVKQAARELGVTRNALYYHIKQGGLPARQLGREYVIRGGDLERFDRGKAGWPRGRPRRAPAP